MNALKETGIDCDERISISKLYMDQCVKLRPVQEETRIVET
jgi:hypothetical protein